MTRQAIYSVGGAVQASGGIYLTRKADAELLSLCRDGTFAYVLAPRQVGKSSLMHHTARELATFQIRSAIVDLNELGIQNTPDQWYCSILAAISRELHLQMDVGKWWASQAGLTPNYRLSLFFQDVLLPQVPEHVVIFVDEIDTTLDLDFSDDFFTAIRFIYNARPTIESFRRLSFVLIGTASPGDLISGANRTPFNIGQRVDLQDFSFDEALPLATGLDRSKTHASQILRWILEWTDGHPYLTQQLCAVLSRERKTIHKHDVGDMVRRLFLGKRGKRDDNLQLAQDKLLADPQRGELLKLYARILEGEDVPEKIPATQNKLSLIGLVKAQDGFLRVRNQIYKTAFDLEWVREHTPNDWYRIGTIAFVTLLILGFLAWGGVSARDAMVDNQLETYRTAFYNAPTSSDRLSSLADIFRARGVLRNTDTVFQARELFFLLFKDQQLALFSGIDLAEPDKELDLTTVIKGLYVTFAELEPSTDTNELLSAMHTALEGATSEEGTNLRKEIHYWLNARGILDDYGGEVLSAYSQAILAAAEQNPATLYERAHVRLIEKSDVEGALEDLNKVMALARQNSEEAPATPAGLTPTPLRLSPAAPSETPPLDGADTTATPAIGSPPPTFTLTPTPTSTGAPTDTATPPPDLGYEGVTLENAACLDWSNRVLTVIARGERVSVLGKNKDGAWYMVRSPGMAFACWVESRSLDPNNLSPEVISRISDPFPPAPAPTFTPTSVPPTETPSLPALPEAQGVPGYRSDFNSSAGIANAVRLLLNDPRMQDAFHANPDLYPALAESGVIPAAADLPGTPTATPPPGGSREAVMTANASCYDESFQLVTEAKAFQPVLVLGRNEAGTWYLVRWSGFITCWVQSDLLKPSNFTPEDLFVISEPFPPALTPTIPPGLTVGGADEIAFTSRNDIYLMTVDGSDLRQLTNTNQPKFDLQWLPTRNELLYGEGDCIYKIDVETAQAAPEQLACFDDPRFTGFRVSPDGQWVAISIERLLVLPFDLPVLSSVSSAFELQSLEGLCLDYAEVSVEEAQWSADGGRLAVRYQSVVRNRIGDTIRVIEINKQRCQDVSTVIWDEFPADHFVPDGYERFPLLPSYAWDGDRRFLFNSFKRNDNYGELYVYDMSTETATKINPIGSGTCCYGAAAFSPDGNYILLTFQDFRLGENTRMALYYIPIDQLGTGAAFTPFNLPAIFFSNLDETIQLALRPTGEFSVPTAVGATPAPLVSSTLAPCTLPDEPSILSVTRRGQSTSVDLTWNVASGATEYEVFRSVNGDSFSSLGRTNGTSMNDSISVDSVYRYYVVVVNSCGNGKPSNIVEISR